MENKLVIFDLDGTVCDTLPDLTYYINVALKKYGRKELTAKQVREYVCAPSRELLRLCMDVEEGNEIIDACHNFYEIEYKNSGSPRTRLYDGIENLVLTLKEKGFKIAILTNKTQVQTDVIYDKYIKHLGFDKVVGLRKGIVPKPEPTEIFNLMKEFNTTKENTYFIGDGDTDVMAALNAGVKLIAVTYGYRDEPVLFSLGARNFARTPQEIADFILKD